MTIHQKIRRDIYLSIIVILFSLLAMYLSIFYFVNTHILIKIAIGHIVFIAIVYFIFRIKCPCCKIYLINMFIAPSAYHYCPYCGIDFKKETSEMVTYAPETLPFIEGERAVNYTLRDDLKFQYSLMQSGKYNKKGGYIVLGLFLFLNLLSSFISFFPKKFQFVIAIIYWVLVSIGVLSRLKYFRKKFNIPVYFRCPECDTYIKGAAHNSNIHFCHGCRKNIDDPIINNRF